MILINYFNAVLIVFYQYFTILSTINKEIIIIIIIIIITIKIIIEYEKADLILHFFMPVVTSEYYPA